MKPPKRIFTPVAANYERMRKEYIENVFRLMLLIEKTDEVGDCLIWNGYVCKTTGYPQTHVTEYNTTGTIIKKRAYTVRRYVYLLCGGALEHRQPVESTCDDKRCINFAHLYASNSQLIAKKAADQGKMSSMSRRIAIAMARRAKGTKLTMEQAREIRASDKTSIVLAGEYGVSKKLIQDIRHNRVYAEFASPFAGLFTGLMAANTREFKRRA